MTKKFVFQALVWASAERPQTSVLPKLIHNAAGKLILNAAGIGGQIAEWNPLDTKQLVITQDSRG
jgi:hypothetical protein